MVVARVTRHMLRMEREYNLCRAFVQTSDPDSRHVPKVIDLVPLPARPEDGDQYICMIVEAPGRNYLKDLTDFGPAFLAPVRLPENDSPLSSDGTQDGDPGSQRVSVSTFLDFAIGACESL